MHDHTPIALTLTLVVLSREVCAFIPSQSRALPLQKEAANHVPFSSQQTERRVPYHIFAALGDQDEESSSNNADGSGAGRVSVEIITDLPRAATVSGARDAWIEHHWIKGGGLGILSLQRDTTNEGSLRRVIAPIMMEEVVDLSKDEAGESADDSLVLEYRVTKAGPAFALDLIDGSHLGTVSFEPNSNSQGYTMIWSVQFDTKRMVNVYKKVTEFTIGTAARTVAEATSMPRVLTLDATLKDVDDPIEARKKWLEFIWASGGGLPLPSPIMKGETLIEGGGKAKRELLRIPPLITEKILSTSESSDGSSAQLEYQLYRPGLTTFPFLMHTHHAKVNFTKGGEESIDLHWEVAIRPFPIPIVKPLVEKLTEMTVATLIRNFVVHLAEPGAQVEIRPPRGNADLAGGVQSFGSVPKDSWIGGVLSAHLTDNRTTIEQILSLLRPWTWGRSGNGDESDKYVRYEWSDEQ